MLNLGEIRHEPATYKELGLLPAQTQVTMKVTIVQEIRRKEGTDFAVYRVEDSTGTTFNLSGVFESKLKTEQTYEVFGEVSYYKERAQLDGKGCFIVSPTSPKGVKKFLKTLKGMGTKAEEIFTKYMGNSLEIIRTQPMLIAEEIKGVSQKRALEWAQELELEQQSRQFLIELLELGLTAKAAKALLKEKGFGIVEKIKQNPYYLAGNVRGYSFAKCDKIAQELGITHDSPVRIKAAILHALQTATQSGHCFLYKGELLPQTQILLTTRTGLSRNPIIHIGMIEEQIRPLIEEEKLVQEEERVYLEKYFKLETTVAKTVVQLSQKEEHYPIEQITPILENLLSENQATLESEQYRAAIEFNRSRSGFNVLVGSAGTGKTYTLRMILELAELLHATQSKEKLRIKVVAPTGKAAKVASASTLRAASTIHKALIFDPENGGFTHNAEDPLPADIIVCDESSMLDIKLAESLFSAVEQGAKVILMGDTKQLPAVGPGNVLKDLIDCGVINVITLTVVKRQGLLSDILKNANNIIFKRAMENYNETKDAFIIQRQGDKSILNTIISSIKRMLSFDNFSLEEIQVLACQRKGTLGINRLNYEIQKEFNPNFGQGTILAKEVESSFYQGEGYGIEKLKLYFLEGDKVIHTRNNYKLARYTKDELGEYHEDTESDSIMNGETGIIDSIEIVEEDGEEKKKIIVKYEDSYVFYEEDFSEIEHAYALTIHKSQGSAWKGVILPIAEQHWKMLDNSLLYTGWTRARDFAVVITDGPALTQAIQHQKANNRNTNLAARIRQIASAFNQLNVVGEGNREGTRKFEMERFQEPTNEDIFEMEVFKEEPTPNNVISTQFNRRVARDF